MTTKTSGPLLLLALVCACEVVPGNKQEQSAASADSVTPVPGDTTAGPAFATVDTVGADSARIRLHPEAPRRGDVVMAFADGVASAPRCTWKGAALPCYLHAGGVLAILPLPADEPAGTFSFVVEHPGGRFARQVTVGDREFARELVFLDPARYALVKRQADVARDARAVLRVLRSESPERRWTGRWREPVALGRAEGYGVERFYHPASDSTRAIRVESRAAPRGSFGGDTVSAAPDVPSWRHAGVDVALRRGTNVIAPANALVADVGEYVLTGRTVLLDHGQGVHSAYFHLDTALVRRGDIVRAGRPVGRVGQTGLATGAHLHYGVYVHGKDVDPAAWHRVSGWLPQAADSAAARADRPGRPDTSRTGSR